MSIIELQKRARELGRIRIGQVVEGTNKKGDKYTRPGKLDRFRLTSSSKPLLEKVAALYGGTVAEWTPANGGPSAWEVLTDATRIPILVPPQPVSQWLELWSGGGCQRRCDGQTETLSDSPCICAAQDDRVCKPTTRLNVVLRDVEGIGVWRLESHGWNAAAELPQAAEFLAHVGGYVEAWLALEERMVKTQVDDKVETRRFMVPTLEVDVTPAQLFAGGGATIPGSALTPGPQPPRAALEAGVPDYLAEAKAATSLSQVQAIWKRAYDAGHLDDDLKAELTRIGDALNGEPKQEAAQGEPPGPEPDADQVWQELLRFGGSAQPPMTLADLSDGFAEFSGGVTADTASGGELQAYLRHLRGEL